MKPGRDFEDLPQKWISVEINIQGLGHLTNSLKADKVFDRQPKEKSPIE